MPPQTPFETKKLVVYVAVVVGALATILAANVSVRGRTLALAGVGRGEGAAQRQGLERLNANPDRCAMTADPSPDNERPMRHANAAIRGPVDVLELGQSDADHMSHDFFRDDVRFYNGFISNSYFVYHYEFYLDLVAAHGPPPLVLYAVGSGYVLGKSQDSFGHDVAEPGWDTPAKEAVWWGFPPFHLGKSEPLPWYRDVPSLLSLAQTNVTLEWLSHQFPRAAVAASNDAVQADTGELFRCVDLHKKSGMNRWMADGSRIYHDEVDGVFAPSGPVRVDKQRGERRVNQSRVAGLEWVLGKLVEGGSKVIVYSPPVHPAVFDDKNQLAIVAASGAAVRAAAEKHGLDYCDLAAEATSLGCEPADFYDENHLSRRCNGLILKRLATGCAPKAGGALKGVLKAGVAE